MKISEILNESREENFKRWFNGSKVVDGAGKPLVVYHGTDRDFSHFTNRDGSEFGFHFGSAAASNSRLGSVTKDQSLGRIIPVYLKIKNPLRIKDMASWTSWKIFDSLRYHKTLKRISDSMPVPSSDGSNQQSYFSELFEWLESNGIDGIVYRNEFEGGGDSFVVFHPNQIKSATGNNGEFDPNNPDITNESREEKNDSEVVMKWINPKIDDVQRQDDLNGTSPWSQNTYGGAPKLLYGEAFFENKMIGRIMIGVYDDLLEMDKVWVDKKYRRTGIAKQMIEAAKRMTRVDNIWAPHTTDDGDKLMKSYPRPS